MFNKVIIVGNLTRDIELKYLPSGSALAVMGLASNRRYKKQDGTQTDEVCFVDVKLFGRTAEVANQYLRKGSQILIEGRLSLETWNDANGAKKSKHTIIAESMQMLGKSQNNEDSNTQYGESAPQNNADSSQSTESQKSSGSDITITDDEIPF